MTTPSPFANSNILITGGAGFLGRGIIRYIRYQGISDARITVYSRDEAKHYAMRARYPEVRTVLGDILDTERLAAVMSGHDIVIHAAALKHIPEAERDVTQAVSINVEGSRSVGWAALRSGVQQVVGVSTDKVCSPRNAYGMTKALMERMFQELARLGQTRFSCVRYGNVISSTGSVVPLFLDQMERQGYLSITAEKMTRFWFGVDDAVRLIEHALRPSLLPNGQVYVARCPALGIMDVATAVLRYKGLNERAERRVIGVRPGEKLHETLVDEHEAPWAILDKMFIAIPPALLMTGASLPPLGSEVKRYSSDVGPLLTIDQFVELIRDAERV